jgi:four helix bundle protein
MRIERFEELEVWKLSRLFVRDIYLVSRSGMISKDYGFKDQIQRAALSIMNNIAEGFERKSSKEFLQFLFIAKSSCGEVRSMLYVGKDIGYFDDETYNRLFNESESISKSLGGFIQYLRKNQSP